MFLIEYITALISSGMLSALSLKQHFKTSIRNHFLRTPESCRAIYKILLVKEKLNDNREHLMDCITNHTESLLEWLTIPHSHKFVDYIPVKFLHIVRFSMNF